MSDTPTLLSNLAPWPAVDFAEFGEIEIKPLSRIQQLTGSFLGRNWVAIPHVTHHDEADITQFDARRRRWNEEHPDQKRTPLPFLVKAAVAALETFPQFNASLDNSGKNLVFKRYLHIGVAVETRMGLLVPVVRDCDKKAVSVLADEIAAISTKARTKGLTLAEMAGGCFTISSLGHIGGTAFTPIVNAPELAILGVSRAQERAGRAPDGGVAWRQTLPLSLSYDHRVINGADAARFVRKIADELANADIV